jgi:hypothetical protein
VTPLGRAAAIARSASARRASARRRVALPEDLHDLPLTILTSHFHINSMTLPGLNHILKEALSLKNDLAELLHVFVRHLDALHRDLAVVASSTVDDRRPLQSDSTAFLWV